MMNKASNLRDEVKYGILLNTRAVKTRDYIHTFLTDDGLEHVMEYNAQKNGTKAFRLFTSGTIYLYQRKQDQFASLRDVRAEIVRKNLLRSDLFLQLSPFIELVSFAASKGCDSLVGLTNDVFTLLDSGANISRLYVYFCERIMVNFGFASDYMACPSCDKFFEDSEKLGYNININAPVCKDCANIYPFLLPGMRRYLSYTQNMMAQDVINVEIEERSIARLCNYETKRFEILGMRKHV